MMVDLSAVGISKKFTIEAIEFALHRTDEKVWEDIGLGLSGLTETEKAMLKEGSPFANSIVIE